MTSRPRVSRRRQPAIPINRFDGVHVDDAGSDSAAAQRFGRGQALVNGDAGTNERDLVVVAGSQCVEPPTVNYAAGS